MPLLTVTGTTQPDRKDVFCEDVATLYAELMNSRTRFLSVHLDSVSREDLWLGRADPDADVVLLEADIREGRPPDQRRRFAVAFVEKVHEEWGIPHPNVKVVFTEHEGAHMMGYDRVGSDWGDRE